MSNFQDPLPPLPLYVQNSSTPLMFDVKFQIPSPHLLMITNQLKENIIQGWLLYVIKSYLQVGLPFQYQNINLAWLSHDLFSFRWNLIFFYGFTLLYVQLSKNITKCLLFITIHIFSTHCFICTIEKVNKLWNNMWTVHVNKRIQKKNMKQKQQQKKQVKSRSNWPHALLFDLAHKQCIVIIHCLTSESKERFLVNNVLMFGLTWCLLMEQIHFFK